MDINVTFLSDISGRIHRELTNRLSRVKSQVEKFSHSIILLDEADEVIRKQDEKMKQEIEAAVKKHIDRIRSHGKAEVAHHHIVLKNRSTELQEMRKSAQRMIKLGEKSSNMTEKVLGNREDLIGMACMYKSLRDVMDKTIAKRPEEWSINFIKESVRRMHFHSTASEVKVGKVNKPCDCQERSEIGVVCAKGPKDLQFTHNGRITVLIEESSLPADEVLYYASGTEQLYSQENKWETRNRYIPYQQVITPVFRQTATSYPFSETFAWKLSIPHLKYDNIKSFTALSANRFAIVSIDNGVRVITDTLHTIPHTSCYADNVTGIASDSKDYIYLSDKVNQQVDIIHDDGSLIKNIPTGQISPTGIAVSHFRPDHIVVTHDPATVSILNLEGKVKASIHKDTWMKVKVACSTENLYLLWSDKDGKVTLQRYTVKGTLVDTLIDKEIHPCKDLIMAVSPEGTVAIVKATGKDGKVLVLHHGK